jgi:hypothetical protein
MAEKFSTYLRNFMMGEGSFRKAFEDSIIKIYQGTVPSSPDDEATGVLLATISVASGAVSDNERSNHRLYAIQISGTPNAGDICAFKVDGVDYDYTLTASDTTLAITAINVARMLDDIPNVQANPVGDTGFIHVQSRIAGVALAIVEDTSTGITVAVTSKQSPSRSDALVFDPPSAGVASKPSGTTWTGLILASGTASYFRLINSNDDGSEDSGFVYPRVQGACATGGGELNLSTLVFVAGATVTISEFDVTFPES